MNKKSPAVCCTDEHDYYGYEMTVVALGYICPELDYTSLAR